MKDSKLFEALRTVEKNDFDRFINFTKSPYFTKNQQLRKLAEFLQDQSQLVASSTLEKEDVYSAVYDDEFNDLRLRHLFSDMLKHLEEFFSVEIFREDNIYLDVNKLSAYRTKGLTKHYDAIDRNVRKGFSKEGFFGSEEAYYKKFLVERELNQLLADTKERTGVTNVVNSSQALDHFFILQKLRYGCMQINQKNILSSDIELFLLEEIVNYVERIEREEHPLIDAYYLALMMLRNPSEGECFFDLHNVLIRSSKFFTDYVNAELYSFAQNYCIGRINKGAQEYQLELFKLYNETISNGIVFIKDEFQPSNFKNIVTVACSLGKFDWAENFISEYGDRLPEDQRSNSISINRAQLHWYRGKHRDAVRILSRVEYEDPFYALNAKSLLLKIYFELDEKEVLLSFCESFRMYLRRNRVISKSHINNYISLINYVSKLSRLKPHQNERLQKIKTDIQSARSLNNKKWLLEKITNIEIGFME